MLKTIEQVASQIDRHLTSDMHAIAVREARGSAETGPWPFSVPLGRPSKAELVNDITQTVHYGNQLASWASVVGLQIRWEERRAGGLQRVPTHVIVPDADTAARIVGRDACRHLARQRTRARVLVEYFSATGDDILETVLRRSDGYADVDFDLLVEASAWFASHDARGMTPRQVPLPGFHAKWLDAGGRRSLVCLLAGKDDLGLADRPASISFSYLDPFWLSGGGRHYDSHVMGDTGALAYVPTLVLIVENKDTYLAFPQVDGGICVFGAGMAGVASLPKVPWIVGCPHLLYWGDMDASGLEILNAYRERGLDMKSLLMNKEAYTEYQRFGTDRASGKRRLADHASRSTTCLTSCEQELYDLLTSADCPGPRRIEQERIPLDRALAEVRRLLI